MNSDSYGQLELEDSALWRVRLELSETQDTHRPINTIT